MHKLNKNDLSLIKQCLFYIIMEMYHMSLKERHRKFSIFFLSKFLLNRKIKKIKKKLSEILPIFYFDIGKSSDSFYIYLYKDLENPALIYVSWDFLVLEHFRIKHYFDIEVIISKNHLRGICDRFAIEITKDLKYLNLSRD